MHFPAFFRNVRRITVRDPLAEFLGAAQGGLLEYGYDDAVKLAGHSCPTVASAYLLTCHALAALYPGEPPVRGDVRVAFRNSFDDGVTGVIASVTTLLTGATQEGGFKGLGGRFVRRDLQHFSAGIPLALRFTRMDTGSRVDAQSDLSGVSADPEMAPLMAACMHGKASGDDMQRFAALWQERVRRIAIDHADDPAVFRVAIGA